MATRLYPTSGAPAISPTAASGWEATGLMTRESLTLTSGSYADNGTPSTVGSGVANEDTVVFQSIYGPIAAQTITGTFKGQIGAREASGLTDARIQCTVRVIGSDGTTVRGTLIAMSTAALASEFTIDAAIRLNRNIPLGGAASNTSVAALAGDYIVIETGFRNHNTNTGAVRMGSQGGTASGDLPVDETTNASGYRIWYEFSQTISPLTAAPAGNAAGTGAANTPSKTVKPTLTAAATGTGAANTASVSYVVPPRSVTINGTDYTSYVREDAFSLTECANRGEVGTGGFDLKDLTSVLDIPALKAVQFTEPGAPVNYRRVFTGFTHERSTAYIADAALAARNWGVETTDLNVLAQDYVLTAADSADRGAETDYARVVWLLTTVFGTTGVIGSGVVPNSNTVTMEATDYRGRKPADVLAECSEAAGKLWFIYDYDAGRKLYYDVATGTSLSSTAKISDVDADTDGSTVFAPVGNVTVKRSPDRIYSKIHLTYNGGTVTVSNAATATAYRAREASVLDSSINDATLATAKANTLLTGAAAELVEIDGLVIVTPLANVNDIRQGQRVQIKLTRQGISSYTYYRVIRRTVTPLGITKYHVALGLASDVLASANGGRGSDDVWPNKSNANDDGATVIVDRGGITVTDGALTLTDAFGSTVMQATGFSGSWADFVRLGLYNGRLQNALVGSIAAGRTSDLPYWTVTKTGAGVLTGLTGGGVTATWGASTDAVYIDSDSVPVQPGSVVEAAFAVLANRAAGTLTATPAIYWYKYDGSASATPTTYPGGFSTSASVTTLLWVRDAVVVPLDALTAKFTLGMAESSHNAANSVSVYAARLKDAPAQVTPYYGLSGTTLPLLTPGSGSVHNYDPGDSLAMLEMAPSGALSLTGLVAPLAVNYRLKFLVNYSSYAITLKEENASSTAANRFNLPGGVDFVVSAQGGALLLYEATGSRWYVVARH